MDSELQKEKESANLMVIATTRAAQEVQAAMVVAKKMPRDEYAVYKRVMAACERPGLAKVAVYTYPRGKTTVMGPSIRLAETIIRAYGNASYGVNELSQDADRGESIVEAFCWDLETNTRVQKTFTVKHARHTKKGSVKLFDPRDVYELTANQGARRVRACILGVVPGDLVEDALSKCQQTLCKAEKDPLELRVKRMLETFKATFGVVSPQVLAYLKVGKPDEISEDDLDTMRGAFQSIKDNTASVNDFFPTQKALSQTATTKTREVTPSAPQPDESKQGDAYYQKLAKAIEGAPGAEELETWWAGEQEAAKEALSPEQFASLQSMVENWT